MDLWLSWYRCKVVLTVTFSLASISPTLASYWLINAVTRLWSTPGRHLHYLVISITDAVTFRIFTEKKVILQQALFWLIPLLCNLPSPVPSPHAHSHSRMLALYLCRHGANKVLIVNYIYTSYIPQFHCTLLCTSPFANLKKKLPSWSFLVIIILINDQEK